MLVEYKDLIKIFPSPLKGLNFPALVSHILQIKCGSRMSLSLFNDYYIL